MSGQYGTVGVVLRLQDDVLRLFSPLAVGIAVSSAVELATDLLHTYVQLGHIYIKPEWLLRSPQNKVPPKYRANFKGSPKYNIPVDLPPTISLQI